VFSSKGFQSWGKDNAILFAAVMTKIEGRKDDELLRTYEFRGFPSMAILDADANAITKTVPRDLFSIRNVVAASTEYVKLAADADAGKKVDSAAWYLAQLGIGKLTAQEAKDQFKGAGLTGEAKSKAEGILFVLEMTELSKSVRGRDTSAEDKTAACVAVYDAFKAGKRLPAGASCETWVDDMLIDAAKSNGDKEAFAHSYERVKARHLKRIDEMKVFLARYQAEAEDNKDDEEKRNRAQTTVGRIETIIEGTKGTLDRLEALAKKLKS
jgi:hypothetical protein